MSSNCATLRKHLVTPLPTIAFLFNRYRWFFPWEVEGDSQQTPTTKAGSSHQKLFRLVFATK